jgi:hypothetical protein
MHFVEPKGFTTVFIGPIASPFPELDESTLVQYILQSMQNYS